MLDPQAVLQARLPRRCHLAGPVEGTARRAGYDTRAALFYALLRRTASAKKGGSARLLDATIDLARGRGLIGPESDLAAIDSTGLESSNASPYFGRRTGRKFHRFPKLSAVIDVGTHLFLGFVIDRGPKPDDIEMHRLSRQAHRRHPFDALLGDVGYDAEHHHEFLYHQLGVLGIIPPQRGRPPNTPSQSTRGFFRQFIKDHWPVAEYGQRWQVETDFSMLKRLLGSAVRSRKRHSIDREIVLRVLAINLMILWRLIC
jgi:hypothetical protein